MAELVRLDWSPVAAANFIDRVADDLARYRESPESRQDLLREARGEMLNGCVLTLLGIALLALTFFLAVIGVISVIIVAAELAVGLVMFARGWARWRLYRRDVLPFEESAPTDRPCD